VEFVRVQPTEARQMVSCSSMFVQLSNADISGQSLKGRVLLWRCKRSHCNSPMTVAQQLRSPWYPLYSQTRHHQPDSRSNRMIGCSLSHGITMSLWAVAGTTGHSMRSSTPILPLEPESRSHLCSYLRSWRTCLATGNIFNGYRLPSNRSFMMSRTVT
jgi:hypothetical protein